MPTVRAIIKRAVDASGPEAALQMQVGFCTLIIFIANYRVTPTVLRNVLELQD